MLRCIKNSGVDKSSVRRWHWCGWIHTATKKTWCWQGNDKRGKVRKIPRGYYFWETLRTFSGPGRKWLQMGRVDALRVWYCGCVQYLYHCRLLKTEERGREVSRQEEREAEKWDSSRHPISRDNRAVTVFWLRALILALIALGLRWLDSSLRILDIMYCCSRAVMTLITHWYVLMCCHCQ